MMSVRRWVGIHQWDTTHNHQLQSLRKYRPRIELRKKKNRLLLDQNGLFNPSDTDGKILQ